MEALGFTSFWGFSPAIDFSKGTTIELDSEKELNILISECADIRHLLKTLADNLPL